MMTRIVTSGGFSETGVELLAQTFTFTLLPAWGLSMLNPSSQQPCKADAVQFPFYR